MQDLIYLILIISIPIIVILFLYLIEKKLRKKLRFKKKDRNRFYQDKIKSLEKYQGGPGKKISALNEIARGFFKEAFGLGHQLGYSELKEEFKKKDKKRCIKFCSQMLKINYSKVKLSKKMVDGLIKDFKEIVSRNKIKISLEKLKKLEEKEKRKEKSLKKEDQKSEKESVKDEEVEEEPEKEEEDSYVPKNLSPEELEKRKNEEWKKRVNKIYKMKNRTEDLINKIFSDKEMLRIAIGKLSSRKELEESFKEKPEKIKKISILSSELIEIYKEVKILFNELYQYSDKDEQKELKKLARDWRTEQKKSLKNIKNPFKRQIEISKILNNYLAKLEMIITLRFNK